MKSISTLFCRALISLCVVVFAAETRAATLTLINSNAQAQVSRSGIPTPNNIVRNDPFSILVDEAQLGGFSSANAFSGIMRFRTSTDSFSGVTGTTNSTSLSYTFRYQGASPLILAAGALTYQATGTMSRDLGTRTSSDPIVTAQTQINSTLVSQVGFGGNVAGNARVVATENSLGNLQVAPVQNTQNVGLTVGQLDQNGLGALYSSAATTISDGGILQFQVTMSGNAGQSGVNPNAVFDVNATADGSNTGVLGLVLPFGVTVEGLAPGQSLSWVTNAPDPTLTPVPGPASIPLLGSGLFLLGCVARRKGKQPA